MALAPEVPEGPPGSAPFAVFTGFRQGAWGRLGALGLWLLREDLAQVGNDCLHGLFPELLLPEGEVGHDSPFPVKHGGQRRRAMQVVSPGAASLSAARWTFLTPAFRPRSLSFS